MNNQIKMVRGSEGMHIDSSNAVKQKIDGETYYFCSQTS